MKKILFRLKTIGLVKFATTCIESLKAITIKNVKF